MRKNEAICNDSNDMAIDFDIWMVIMVLLIFG